MIPEDSLKNLDVASCKKVILAQLDEHALNNMSEALLREVAQVVISARRQKKPDNYPAARIFCTLLFCLLSCLLQAQCSAYPAFPGCSVSGSSTLVSGASINASQTYTFSGTATYSSLTLNGGTLVVCGNLTLNTVTISSGTIFIGPGATLTLYNGGSALVLGANTFIYNFGKFDCKMSIVTGANNLLVNCLSSSVFSVSFDQFVLQGPNTFFVNNGWFDSSYFIVQSSNAPSPVCLGSGSILKTATIINQYTNSFYVQTGSAACVNVTSNVINSNVLTASTGVNVCIPSAVSVISGPNWGAANILNNCPACMVLLPVQLIDFYGRVEGGTALLEWNTLQEHNSCSFIVERSLDAIHFEPADTVVAAGESSGSRHYTSSGPIRAGLIYYFRLKQVDCSGNHTYSPIIDLSRTADGDVLVLPNPCEGFISVYAPRRRFLKMCLYNQLGERVLQGDFREVQDFSFLPGGLYYLELLESSGQAVIIKVQKL